MKKIVLIVLLFILFNNNLFSQSTQYYLNNIFYLRDLLIFYLNTTYDNVEVFDNKLIGTKKYKINNENMSIINVFELKQNNNMSLLTITSYVKFDNFNNNNEIKLNKEYSEYIHKDFINFINVISLKYNKRG